jgi:hypothetical protein
MDAMPVRLAACAAPWQCRRTTETGTFGLLGDRIDVLGDENGRTVHPVAGKIG